MDLNLNVKSVPATQEHNFYLLDFNRDINQRHVTELKKSIIELGIRRVINIAQVNFLEGVKRNYIIDGQHLYYAITSLARDEQYKGKFKRLHVSYEISYPQNRQQLISNISKLNSTGSNWGLGDYVKAWSAVSTTNDYLKLAELKAKYDHTYSTICMVMNNETPGHAVERMKIGKFRIQNQEFGLDILQQLDQVFKTFPRGRHVEQRVFVEAFIQFYKDNRKAYNQAKFIGRITDHSVILNQNLRSLSQCRLVMEHIYKGNINKASQITMQGAAGNKKHALTVTNEIGGKTRTTFLSAK